MTIPDPGITIHEYVYIRTSVSGFNETVRATVYYAAVASYKNSRVWEVYRLANIKSAKKRILVTQTRTDRNKSIRSAVKTSIKKVEAAVAANDKEAAQAALVAATSTIDKAATKGVYHKNNASRKVARLAKLVNSIA